MLHVAIDLGSQKSQICIRDDKGQITQERSCPTNGLRRVLDRLPKPSRVIVETGAESFAVAEMVQELGHEVRVVPATLAPSLGVGEHGIKNDRRDAQKISEASARIDLPSVHIPRPISRRRKAVAGMRESLVGARTKLINCVRGWLRTELMRIRTGSTKSFPLRVRQLFAQEGKELPAFVERMLCAIDDLSEKICAASKELEAEVRSDPECRRLMSTPGIGPITAARYVAAIDTPERFETSAAVASYLGLAPGERQSGARKRITGITKAGDGALRWCLVQAAWVFRRQRPNDPLALWCDAVERRRGKPIAIVALARKLGVVLFAMWRDGTSYKPQLAAAIVDA